MTSIPVAPRQNSANSTLIAYWTSRCIPSVPLGVAGGQLDHRIAVHRVTSQPITSIATQK
jgi:hypothetical protein